MLPSFVALSDAEIRTMLAKYFEDVCTEDWIEVDDLNPTDGDDEIDEIVAALDISDGKAEDYQRFTEQILAKN